MLIAVVIIAVTYFMDDTGISYIMSISVFLWVSNLCLKRKGKNIGKYGDTQSIKVRSRNLPLDEAFMNLTFPSRILLVEIRNQPMKGLKTVKIGKIWAKCLKVWLKGVPTWV